VSAEPSLTDRGSHVEVTIGLPSLRGPDFLDVLARATDRFGRKPILVLCDDPQGHMNFDEAYRVGVDVASRFPLQAVAIVLRGRHPSEAEYFTELVATNRGARVRYFHDVGTARSWLAALAKPILWAR
jgi:hypothetical protein